MKQIIFSILLAAGFAAQAQKKPVQISDFSNWQSIRNISLADNGKILAYKLQSGKGDPKYILHHIEENFNDTLYLADELKINNETSIAAYKIVPTLKQQRLEKKEDLPKDKYVKDSIGILLLKDDTLLTFPKLKNFKLPEDKGAWVAFITDEKYLPPEDTCRVDSLKKERPKLPKGGNNMVIVNGTSADTTLVRNVTEYNWDKSGSVLAYATKIEDSLTVSKVYTLNTENNTSKLLFELRGEIKKLVLDDNGSQLAWLSSKDTLDVKTWRLFYYDLAKKEIRIVADSGSTALPENWLPSEHGSIKFSESGKRLYFGSAPKPKQEPKDTLLSGEKVAVDVWSWTDLELQPRQKINLKKDKNQSYLAVYHIKKDKVVQLATKELKNIRYDVKHDKQYAILSTSEPYLRASNWTGKFLSDYYLVDMYSGEIKPVAKGVNRIWTSPEENFVVYYSPLDSNYYVTDLKKRKTHVLNKGINTLLVDEENDQPRDPGIYGIGAWSSNDKFIYVYDRYDIWQVDPKQKTDPVNLTKGRASKLKYRLIDLDEEHDFIDTDKVQLLSVFNENTKDAGWADIDLRTNAGPKLKVLDAKTYGSLHKAKHADVHYYTRQDCNEYPDLWICNRDMSGKEKISNANPHKKDFIWNTVELVKWRSFNGEPLEGLLYKPENFNPDSIYPMMVYFYERNADNLNRFNSIYPSHSTINKTLYTSNGYLVFVPDIKYRIGHPGMSAYECIVSGVQSLTNKYEWINAEKMALQGQSWGGYQTAYLITQTNLFVAAMAGAPVSNMTSAYGGIRWGSGLSRMFQYEHTQSRIGGTLWDKPLLYIENSPLFYAKNVNTPLLMMHNDNDGAVPWYQGIEYFVALRRLNKPVWLLTYNNEPHNLKPSSWGNRMDLSIRMKQFFDHYLKDTEAPEWMLNGVKAVDKEYMKGF